MTSFRRICLLSSRVMNGSKTLTLRTVNKTRTIGTRIANIPTKVNDFAKRRPLIFGSGISLLKTIGADLAVQTYLENKKINEIDWKRTASIGAFGFFYLGMYQHCLYSKVFPRVFGKMKNKRVAGFAQMATDTLIHAPLVYFPVYYLYRNTINEAMSKKQFSMASINSVYSGYFCNSIKKDVPMMWKVWVPAHIITFNLIPLHLRVPWITMISFGWTMMLSYSTNKQ